MTSIRGNRSTVTNPALSTSCATCGWVHDASCRAALPDRVVNRPSRPQR